MLVDDEGEQEMHNEKERKDESHATLGAWGVPFQKTNKEKREGGNLRSTSSMKDARCKSGD